MIRTRVDRQDPGLAPLHELATSTWSRHRGEEAELGRLRCATPRRREDDARGITGAGWRRRYVSLPVERARIAGASRCRRKRDLGAAEPASVGLAIGGQEFAVSAGVPTLAGGDIYKGASRNALVANDCVGFRSEAAAMT